MCGRFGFAADEDLIMRYALHGKSLPINKRYNVAPSQFHPVIYGKDGNVEVEVMKWGLVPFWADTPKIGYKMINARIETIKDKNTYKNAFNNGRCLIPATNFYEWRKDDKQPFCIKLKDKKYFSFAGMYETWKDPEGKEMKTFTIVTKSPNKFMSQIHDRMPVILDEDEEEEWIHDNDKNFLFGLLESNTREEMEMYPISTLVNSPKNDIPEVLEPL